MWKEDFFSFGKKKTDRGEKEVTEQEKEIIRAAHTEADPTTFSHLSLSEKPVKVGMAREFSHPIVEHEGERYIEISRSEELQQAAARIFKGIVNVSDIISAPSHEGDDERLTYSHEIPLDRVEHHTSEQEMRADVLLLRFLIGDSDRVLYLDTPYEPHNARIENGKAAYFDFEGAHVSGVQQEYPFNELHTTISNMTSENEREVLQLMRKKAETYIERYKGPDGYRMLYAIVGQSGKSALDLFVPYDEARKFKLKTQNPDEVAMLQSLMLDKAYRLLYAVIKREEELAVPSTMPYRKAA